MMKNFVNTQMLLENNYNRGPIRGSNVTVTNNFGSWYAPGRLLNSSQTSFSTVTLSSATSQSDYAFVTGFGFNIPTNKTIKNITVQVYGALDGPYSPSLVFGLCYAGTQRGNSYALGLSNTQFIQNSLTNTPRLWYTGVPGFYAAPAIINNSSFGCVLSISGSASSSSAAVFNEVTIIVEWG